MDLGKSSPSIYYYSCCNVWRATAGDVSKSSGLRDERQYRRSIAHERAQISEANIGGLKMSPADPWGQVRFALTFPGISSCLSRNSHPRNHESTPHTSRTPKNALHL